MATEPVVDAGTVRVTLLRGIGAITALTFPVAASSRRSISIGSSFNGASGRFGILVESVDTPPLPLVVEAAIYASPGGVTWASGGAAQATPIP